MTRTIPTEMRNAIDGDVSYTLLVKAEVYPSRVFHDTITFNNPIAGADTVGVVDDPQKQDIEYSAVSDALVTFVSDSVVKYAKSGSATLTSTSYSSDVKPGVLGSKIYIYDGADVKRYAIDWNTIDANGANPFSQEASVTPTLTIDAVHAVSSTESVLIGRDGGGFRPILMAGTTQDAAPVRFMFPTRFDWDGSGRTMREMAIFSGAARLGNKVFVYMSNASLGSVEGIFYDYDTGIWSDIFIALPVDLQVSLCEFRVSNAYTRNGTIYVAGQFIRTDLMEGGQPYSLLLSSVDGKTLSFDRFTLVSNLGWRFLARVGSDNKVYLGNSNRVCVSPVTWVFDGTSGTSGTMELLTSSHIKRVADKDASDLTLELVAGAEQYFDSATVVVGARVKLYTGMTTTAGDQWVLYGTYIVDDVNYSIGVGERGTQLRCTNESQWKLRGLSMPFYAELLGKSSMFDHFQEASGKLYTAPGGSLTVTKFQVDFWKHEGWSNSGAGVTAFESYDDGGVNYYVATGATKLGMITSEEVKDLLGLKENPTITATSVDCKVYGWSHPIVTGKPNDQVDVILVTEDDEGVETETWTNAGQHWPFNYPEVSAGTDPIQITVSGLTVGHKIKKVGVIFWCSTNTTWFNIARVEFVAGVEAPIAFDQPNLPWEVRPDGTFKVPQAGRPFIMFAQKPYNAWNFNLNGFFSNTVTQSITGYPTACGIIGHAEDAGNYTYCRFNTANGKLQIGLARNGIEFTMAAATPTFTHTDTGLVRHGIQFSHKDGKFSGYMWNYDIGAFDLVVTYEWQDTDGFMFTSDVAVMKCGIYGNISAPFVRTLAYYPGFDETTSQADGLPVDPLFSLTDFPASGTLRIGENTYSYTGKITHPTIPRGPYQVRQHGIYTPPYGTGAGLETRDFNYGASTSLINGKLISIDNGANFLASGAKWDIFNTTGGVTTYFYNRARYYSANQEIAQVYLTLSNKVWVVGGFSGVNLKSGTKIKHSEGSIAMLSLPGTLKAYWFFGSGGPDDTTVGELVSRVAELSGARAEFPGDYVVASQAISGETQVFRDSYSEGFDLRYETASPATHEIRLNIKIKPDNYENKSFFENDTGCKLVVTHQGAGVFLYEFQSTPSNTSLFAMRYTSGTGRQKFRALVYDNFVSLYQNGRWVTTIALDELLYNDPYVDIKVSGSLTLENIRVLELGDWREAVYIDLETDGQSALRSIMQERPIEVYARPNGAVSFAYNYPRDVITAVRDPRAHSWRKSIPTEGASDAIVYGSNEVFTFQSPAFADALGFSTKVVRMPNLDSGARMATAIMMQRLYEGRIQHALTVRPDLALLPGDIYSVDYTAVGTGRNEVKSVMVEGVSLSFSSVGKTIASEMSVKGREYVPFLLEI